ncbi:MAG: Rpn family recombination-promoting nuclease/putative transposase [Deltaproteobacteria bacterium]|nr:Rpn family recombination-promoting nuclease/putative transposase [Deltaproteobacteria bacterium]
MAYADLKNDVVFRKIFGHHADVTMGLLNDLLGRAGAQAITALEFLPPDQAPVVPGFKYSIVDVKCRDASGTTFVVEMQVLPVTGFLNRVVYNACKAYVGTLVRGAGYHALTDVVAVSLCDFELWPDAERDRAGQPRVPLRSRWEMTERTAGGLGIPQVQYVFVELPKLGDRVPADEVERWVALFRAAPILDPGEMAAVPLTNAQRHCLALAQEETFTPAERDAIERAHEEVDQFRRTVLAEAARARAEGRTEGSQAGRREALRTLARVAGIALSARDEVRIDACVDAATLDRWIANGWAARDAGELFG